MKNSIVILIFTLFSFGLSAQIFNVPKDYSLVKAEDYAPYEKDIIKCVDWLMVTPLNGQVEKRKEAYQFLLKWVTGSPNVTIELKENIVTFMGTNPDLLLIFMGGWTKYALETKKGDDKVGGTKAGIEAVIKFYSSNKELMAKDKNVEKYIKMQSKGTLDDFLAKNV